MKIVGYSDPFSVQPREEIRFMVSCELPSYRADVVRLVHGDDEPAGPGFKEELVETPVNGRYAGRKQDIHSGSYGLVSDAPQLRPSDGFTLQCWIYSTTPDKGVQGILTKGSYTGGSGYGLFLDGDGSLGMWLCGEDGDMDRLTTGVPLRGREWYFVATAYDPQRATVSLYQTPLRSWPGAGSGTTFERRGTASSVQHSESPLLLAAFWDGDGSVPAGYFNGKIDAPRVFGRPLSGHEVDSLRDDTAPERFGDALIASWDFSRDISSSRITDTGPNGLHGHTVNMPARAMTGHNWTDREHDFKHGPKEYGAIHFHDDDLENAGWESDFALPIPPDMKSGVYAVRLRAGEGEGSEDYVPFVVRPGKGAPPARVLFLMPTGSYLAYANSHTKGDPESWEWMSRLAGREIRVEYPVQPQDKYMVEHNLLSLYDLHTDGSGVCYSSRLRPILNMRPKYKGTNINLGEGGAHQLNADLHLLDWMEAKGFEFDVVTDEDLNFEGPDLLKPYRVVVTGSHPEYWSAPMLDAVEAYQEAGGRLMYLGGNGLYWIISFDPERPHVIEVRRWYGTRAWEAGPGEYYHSTTGELGGLWRFRGRPPQRLVGVGFVAQGYDRSVPYRRQPGSYDPRAAFIFEGISDEEVIGDFGLVMGGAGGFEVDRADTALGTPLHALILATATGLSRIYQHAIEELLEMDPEHGGDQDRQVRDDMVYFETPNGGGVFSVGSIAWCGSLSHNGYINNVSRITENVLRRFSS